MKKVFIGLAVLTLIAVGAIAYAQGPGWYGNNQGGPCYGYGYHMKGVGYGGPMMGWRGTGYDQKFLDETAGLRKELHEKRFDYIEAMRNPKTDPETVAKLGRESGELRDKIHAKAPRGQGRGFRTPCWRQSEAL
jgi:hypothetical protein